MLIWIIAALVYLLMIPGMYVVGCCIDRIGGVSVADSNFQGGWGLAIVWPMLVFFLVVMFVLVLIISPFSAAAHGREHLRDAVMKVNK